MLEKIISYIKRWQKENDKEFKPLPTDDHEAIIFNINGQQIYKFIFSDRYKRDECRLSIPQEYFSDIFFIMIDQEEGFTFYQFNQDGD